MAAFVGPAEPDFVEPAVVAQADLAGLVDLVLAYSEVGAGRGAGGPGLDPGAVGLQRRAPVEGSVWADVVVVVQEAVELALKL